MSSSEVRGRALCLFVAFLLLLDLAHSLEVVPVVGLWWPSGRSESEPGQAPPPVPLAQSGRAGQAAD